MEGDGRGDGWVGETGKERNRGKRSRSIGRGVKERQTGRRRQRGMGSGAECGKRGRRNGRWMEGGSRQNVS